jgi:hypothetical protein
MLDIEQIIKADVTRGTLFTEKAKPAPRYGGSVPPVPCTILLVGIPLGYFNM